MTYKRKKYLDGTLSGIIIRKSDQAQIPPNPSNTDYQEYLKWVEEGNTADPAD